ncbi:spore germination protein GerPC [Cohnella terricola]|uniref:Uncharacterized protein n=1 Tax=Cohnella terricola TaxID=1289167 RepID=A0A559JX06_9BACL|nr:spore germination protein GerPC [Cohnella terricola]TVY04421.1 hypothetical protein FPZ45_02235 [Cohnella terricola]
MQQSQLWNGVYQTPQQPVYPYPAQVPIAPNWHDWAQRLYQAEQKLKEQSDQIANLQQQLNDVKNKPPLHVEYHFDQLKVSRLEGTLNVGMSPQGVQGIESLETPDPSCWQVANETPDAALPAIRDVQKEMADYMSDQSNKVLVDLEQQIGVALDSDHRKQVIDDVKRQLNTRVNYYARTSVYPAEGTDDERKQWRDSIVQKTKRDIQGAFTAYLSNQKNTQSRKGGSDRP